MGRLSVVSLASLSTKVRVTALSNYGHQYGFSRHGNLPSRKLLLERKPWILRVRVKCTHNFSEHPNGENRNGNFQRCHEVEGNMESTSSAVNDSPAAYHSNVAQYREQNDSFWARLSRLQKRVLIHAVSVILFLIKWSKFFWAIATSFRDSLKIAWWDEGEESLYSSDIWKDEPMAENATSQEREPNSEKYVNADSNDSCDSSSLREDFAMDDEDLDPWWQVWRLWNNPSFVKFRVSVSLANLTMSFPTLLARVWPFVHQLSKIQSLSQVVLPLRELSLPILAPLLFGGGIVFKSVTNNLGYVIPKIGTAAVVMWVLWGLNSVMQEAVSYLRDHGALDRRVSDVFVMAIELTVSSVAVIACLSSAGVKISSLVLPFFVLIALSGKDVFQNYCAGFFLFAAQPFRPGDSIAVLCNSAGAPPAMAPSSHIALGTGWFEGVCESVDLRFTVVRNGRYRLMIPNSRFIEREFLVLDNAPLVQSIAAPSPRASRTRQQQQQQQAALVMGNSHTNGSVANDGKW